MKTITMLSIAVLVCANVAMAQIYTSGTGITGIDKLGPHQNGGRGCVGCHTPHSGVRGNGGALTGLSQLTPNTSSPLVGPAQVWTNQTTPAGAYGDTALWGQDIGPIMTSVITTGGSAPGGYQTNFLTMATINPGIISGIAFCLSCHDGNVAKGAMMTNMSFEQAAGLLPNTYGSQPIPTLLGNDGGTTGDYANDHPVGPNANMGALSAISKYVQLNAGNTAVVLNPSPSDQNYAKFQANYGTPLITGGHGGWVVDPGMTAVATAYVTCTTCHTPHTMSVYTGASAANPIAGNTAAGQMYPTYFFINAPYNPGANTANGTKASSATQFCRQCHFSGAGGANESVGIYNIGTAF